MASHVIDTAGHSLFAQVAQHWHGLRAYVATQRRERARRATVARELASYNDRELADLGVSRADIPAIIAGTYRRS